MALTVTETSSLLWACLLVIGFKLERSQCSLRCAHVVLFCRYYVQAIAAADDPLMFMKVNVIYIFAVSVSRWVLSS